MTEMTQEYLNGANDSLSTNSLKIVLFYVWTLCQFGFRLTEILALVLTNQTESAGLEKV